MPPAYAHLKETELIVKEKVIMHRSIGFALAVAALTLPIVVDGQVIGGIGASFDTSEHDVQIAQAGLAALSR